eukprot:428868-Alexandrium_andersonii.AAC.1
MDGASGRAAGWLVAQRVPGWSREKGRGGGGRCCQALYKLRAGPCVAPCAPPRSLELESAGAR